MTTTLTNGMKIRVHQVDDRDRDVIMVGTLALRDDAKKDDPDQLGMEQEGCLGAIDIEWPPHLANSRRFLFVPSQVKEVAPAKRHYPIEYVKHQIERLLSSLGHLSSVMKVEISDEQDIDVYTDTTLHHIDVKSGWCEFSIYEIVEPGQDFISYIASIVRMTGVGSFENPPEPAEWNSKVAHHPTVAIIAAIKANIEEVAEAHPDSIEFLDWKGEPQEGT